MKRLSLVFALFITASMVMVSCGGSTEAPAKEEAPAVEEAPVTEEAAVKEAPAVEETVVANYENGKATYDKMCNACHGAGVAGAAKLDDKARWEVTAAKGLETIDNNAINGYTGDFGTMPPKGGMATFTDEEVKEAVAYMLHEAGVTAE